MVEILALVLHLDDEQAVLVAVELARWSDGVPSKTHILNRLHRLIDGKPATSPVVLHCPAGLGLDQRTQGRR